MKLLLPDSLPLSPDLPADVDAVVYNVREPIPEEHLDADALVVWGNHMRSLRSSAPQMTNLRWVQALSAGTDNLVDLFDDDVVITSGSGLHDATVSEHTVALILAMLRQLPESAKAQAEHRWAFDLGGSQDLRPEGRVTSLIGANVLVWGFGSIGTHLAPILAAFGANVRGVARSAGERAGFDVVTRDDLPQVLPETDVLVMILPATDETEKALSREELDALPDHAVLVNVGRGSTVDEDALIEALRDGRLGGAGLDVTAVEPLPEDSPLWDAPSLLITPHSAGGRPVGADELLGHNVHAFVSGGDLRNVVER